MQQQQLDWHKELQRSGYRVVFQMGMGLLAQLGAALNKPL